jgi:hypothetical protein
MRGVLLRGIDADPPPSSAELRERLSERGEVERQKIVTHCEAIALQGILSFDQSRLLRKVIGDKVTGNRGGATAMLAGRSGTRETRSMMEQRPPDELINLLRLKAERYTHVSGVIGKLVADGGMSPQVELSEADSDAARRLDELTIAIFRASLTRGVDDVPGLSQAALAQRLWEGGDRLRDSLFAHAEAIAVAGFLRADQADQIFSVLWKQSGTRALLDPGLAARLRLSKTQTSSLDLLLKERKTIEDASLDAQVNMTVHPEMAAQLSELVAHARLRRNAVEEVIWDVLTPSQSRTLERMLDTAEPARPPAEGVKKKGKAR